jgi:hypothetical protein
MKRFWVAALLFAAPSLAHAQAWSPLGRGKTPPPPPPGFGTPIVQGQWSDEVIKQRYKMSPGIGLVNRIMEIINPPFDWAMDDVDNEFAQKIADGCKSTYAGDTWKQIHCISEMTDFVLKSEDLDKFPRSFCRLHARLFQEAFQDLNIPGSEAGPVIIAGFPEGHVVNRITLTGPDGQYYAYVIDTGWDPDKIYPLTDATKRWHDEHGQQMPPLPGPGQTISYQFRPAEPPAGNNIGRNVNTTGGIPVAGGGATAGGGQVR